MQDSEANLKEITGSIVYMGIHGSDCHKPFPQSDPPQIFFVSSGGWGEEYNKVCRGS